jgi:hypothetical protein
MSTRAKGKRITSFISLILLEGMIPEGVKSDVLQEISRFLESNLP